jgi:cell division transport system permease protein
MQLVGATNAFIRIPLVIEGIFFGAVGAFLSWLLIQAGGIYVMRTMHGITGMFRTCRTGVSPETQLCALLILGVFVGMWGSLISMRRFLKLQ